MKTVKSLGRMFGNGTQPWYMKDDPWSDLSSCDPYVIQHHDMRNKFMAEYQLDEFGFRQANGLDSKLWFFGCSITFGEALPVTGIYPELLSRALQTSHYNFGTPGASVELIARLLFKLRAQLKDHTIVILLPPPDRYETIVGNQFHSMVPTNDRYMDFLPMNEIDGHMRHRCMMAIMMISSLLAGCKHYIFTYSTYDSTSYEDFVKQLAAHPVPVDLIIDSAADNSHFGPLTHARLAEYMLPYIDI